MAEGPTDVNSYHRVECGLESFKPDTWQLSNNERESFQAKQCTRPGLKLEHLKEKL